MPSVLGGWPSEFGEGRITLLKVAPCQWADGRPNASKLEFFSRGVLDGPRRVPFDQLPLAAPFPRDIADKIPPPSNATAQSSNDSSREIKWPISSCLTPPRQKK